MNTKVFIIALIIVILLGVGAFYALSTSNKPSSGQTVNDTDGTRQSANTEDVTPVDSADNISADVENMTERERYMMFDAEMGCELAKASLEDDPNAVMRAMSKAKTIGTKYGLTSEQARSLNEQYAEDQEFIEDSRQEMMEMCPDALEKAQEENSS